MQRTNIYGSYLEQHIVETQLNNISSNKVSSDLTTRRKTQEDNI